ncbi:MAG: ABC transporter permease [candidate division WOR-3 bacterium]
MNKPTPHCALPEFRRVVRIFFGRKVVSFGFFVILIFVTAALFPFLFTSLDPYEQNLAEALKAPSKKHVLGTDALGRDILARIIYGARISLVTGVLATFLAAFVGMSTGLLAGYYGGLVNTIIMRFTDAVMCFPPILSALVISGLLGAGLTNVVIAIGFTLYPAYCRLMCAQTLTVKENEYILAARSFGASNLRIMIRHVLPNCFPPLIVLITMNMGTAILSEAGLSFLGVGIKPPMPAWGAMVSDGYLYLRTHPVLSFAPGLAIMLVVFAFNMVGDGLRDALDPRLRGRI